MSHPLVGKRIVHDNPVDGEVSIELVRATFTSLTIIGPNIYEIQNEQSFGVWTVHLDTNNVVTHVYKT